MERSVVPPGRAVLDHSTQCVRVIAEHTDAVGAVCVTADGRFVFSGSVDRTVKQHDALTGTVRASAARRITRS